MKKIVILVSWVAMSFSAFGEEVTAEKMNEMLGIPLFSEAETLWNEDVAKLAERIGLKPESKTALDESYRIYSKEDARLLGRRPYSIAMSGREGKPVALSMIFANKGDSVGVFSPTAPGRLPPRVPAASLREYRKAIKDDDNAIEAALTNVLGAAQTQKVGQGSKMQERALRWDWKGHAILLVSVRDEYVSVRILPSEELDSEEKQAKVSTRDMKTQLLDRVERRDNGDVVLKDLPMTDQGPKGFCVPATMERVLRYFGIPADMYLIALAGNTQPGGGTTVRDVIWAVSDTVRRAGRKITPESGMPDMARVSKWIDAGLPVIWAITTSETINQRINEHTEKRKQVSDWADWNKSLKADRKNARNLAKTKETGHVCLIIGYNKETGEFAISDSWGPRYEERWITQEEAGAISQGSMAIVSW